MKYRDSNWVILCIAAIAIALAQLGCSRRSAENSAASAPPAASTPSPSPESTAAPEPTPDTSSPMEGASSASSGPGASSGSGVGRGTRQRMASDARAGEPAGGYGSERAGTPPPVEERPAPPRVYTLAAGSTISVWTSKDLSTKTAKSGDVFVGTLAKSIVDHDWVIARQGAPVEGVVVNSDPGGRVKGVASLTVKLRRLTMADGRKLELLTSSYTKQAKATHTKDAEKIIGGAGIGAVIGAIAGGGKGAAIGAAAGGGAGTGYVLATRGDPAVIQGESQLTFRVNSPVRITRVER